MKPEQTAKLIARRRWSDIHGYTDGSDELMHHGVKGMKWGVKNGPPYPVIDGTKRRELNLRTATRYQFDDVNYKNRDTYISYNKQDKKNIFGMDKIVR